MVLLHYTIIGGFTRGSPIQARARCTLTKPVMPHCLLARRVERQEGKEGSQVARDMMRVAPWG